MCCILPPSALSQLHTEQVNDERMTDDNSRVGDDDGNGGSKEEDSSGGDDEGNSPWTGSGVLLWYMKQKSDVIVYIKGDAVLRCLVRWCRVPIIPEAIITNLQPDKIISSSSSSPS